MQRRIVYITIICLFFAPNQQSLAATNKTQIDLSSNKSVIQAHQRLNYAIKHPEYLLDHWVELPTSPSTNFHNHKIFQLSLREAILLALRYNPNIQNAELDRIIQRYQLRLAHNEFELQFALAGSALIQNSRYSGAGNATTHNYIAAPEFSLKNKLGGQASLKMENTVAIDGNYTPLLNLTLSQPLLRGFGFSANEAGLLNALDNELLNQLNLQQTTMNQITQVILTYRALIVSSYQLKNAERQLVEARNLYKMNEKKITAGQLEPTANTQQAYQIESLTLMREQAENELATNAQTLLQTIGLDPSMHLAIPSDAEIPKQTIPDEAVEIRKALQHNAEYVALQMLLRADERAYEVAKNQQLWQLDATANMQLGVVTGVDSAKNTNSGNNIYSGHNTNESAGVTLTIPLHDVTRQNQLVIAKVHLEKDRLNLLAAKRELITMIKNSISTIKSLVKCYELAKRQVNLAQESYLIEKKKQQIGIASALDVNNTQNQLIFAEMSLINAKIAYLNQLSTLQRMVGSTLNVWHIHLRYTGQT